MCDGVEIQDLMLLMRPLTVYLCEHGSLRLQPSLKKREDVNLDLTG